MFQTQIQTQILNISNSHSELLQANEHKVNKRLPKRLFKGFLTYARDVTAAILRASQHTTVCSK